MKEEDLVDLKAAMAEAEKTGDYGVLNKMVRPLGVPEPTENSVRDRNVPIEEVEDAGATLRALKETSDDHVAIKEAGELVNELRAAYREGEVEAGRRSAGVSIVTG